MGKKNNGPGERKAAEKEGAMKTRFLIFTSLFLMTAALSIIAAGWCGPWIAFLVCIAGVCVMTDYAEASNKPEDLEDSE